MKITVTTVEEIDLDDLFELLSDVYGGAVVKAETDDEYIQRESYSAVGVEVLH